MAGGVVFQAAAPGELHFGGGGGRISGCRGLYFRLLLWVSISDYCLGIVLQAPARGSISSPETYFIFVQESYSSPLPP